MADGGDPTLLATGLIFPPSVLNVYGGWAYWYENANGQTTSQEARLRAIPVSGGCGEPVTIDSISADASASPLPTNIAYDGTDVYWTRNGNGSGGQGLTVVKAALGSSTATSVATSSSQYLGANTFNDDMLFTGGSLYLMPNGDGVLKVATSGGAITPETPPTGVNTTALWAIDGTDLYFEQYDSSGASTFYAAPLSLASATALATTPTTNFSAGMAVSNGNAYIITYSQTGNPQTSQLNIVPVAGADGGGGLVVPFQNFNAQAIVADGNGVYLADVQGGNSTYPAGIYSVSASGALTLVHTIGGGFSGLAIDATNVYWIDGAGLHELAR